jgi:hypothetical protein
MTEFFQQFETVWFVTESFVAERDCIVVETNIGVFVGRAFIKRDRILLAAEPHIQVTHPIVQRQIEIGAVTSFANPEHFAVGMNGFIPFFLLLVLACFVF